MKRSIIRIDEEKCTGCAQCIPNCPEGAIQMIDGKARLVSDLFCDGLGACLGHCPEGAIAVEEREAQPYSERQVMENIVKQGPNVIRAHLEHLRDHNEKQFLAEAEALLQEKGLPNPLQVPAKGGAGHAPVGCPGSQARSFAAPKETAAVGAPDSAAQASELTQWPVQLHLVSPVAPYYHGRDVVLAADCVAFALGDFHRRYLKGNALAIACPKLDDDQDEYVEKITALIDQARINTLTVMIMEVPCCSGLLRLAQSGAQKATRKVPIKCIVIGLQGDVKREEWA